MQAVSQATLCDSPQFTLAESANHAACLPGAALVPVALLAFHNVSSGSMCHSDAYQAKLSDVPAECFATGASGNNTVHGIRVDSSVNLDGPAPTAAQLRIAAHARSVRVFAYDIGGAGFQPSLDVLRPDGPACHQCQPNARPSAIVPAGYPHDLCAHFWLGVMTLD